MSSVLDHAAEQEPAQRPVDQRRRPTSSSAHDRSWPIGSPSSRSDVAFTPPAAPAPPAGRAAAAAACLRARSLGGHGGVERAGRREPGRAQEDHAQERRQRAAVEASYSTTISGTRPDAEQRELQHSWRAPCRSRARAGRPAAAAGPRARAAPSRSRSSPRARASRRAAGRATGSRPRAGAAPRASGPIAKLNSSSAEAPKTKTATNCARVRHCSSRSLRSAASELAHAAPPRPAPSAGIRAAVAAPGEPAVLEQRARGRRARGPRSTQVRRHDHGRAPRLAARRSAPSSSSKPGGSSSP